MSGKDTIDFNSDSSGNLGVPFDTSPDLSGEQINVILPDPDDTMQESTRNEPRDGRSTHEHVTRQDPDITRPDPDITRQDNADITRQDVHSSQSSATERDFDDGKTDPDVNAGPKVWADPLALDETDADPFAPPNYGGRQGITDADKTQRSIGGKRGAERDATNWDALDKSKSNASASAGASKSRSQSPNTSDVPRVPDSRKLQIGAVFANKYEIAGHIGQGGMGVVYKAVDMILGRTVAIKLIKANSKVQIDDISRFRHEAVAIARLDHPNIIRVYEMHVTADGDPYFVLEYLQGNALSTEVRGRKGIPLDESISIVTQVCDALQHAHESGVVHRDLKPSNIMLVKSGGRDVVKLLDFGIAKRYAVDEATLPLLQLTKTGQIFGSPHYMSPEQCHGKANTPASDIYSLGCMFFEMITGNPPFSGEHAFATMDMHQNSPVPSVGDACPEQFVEEVDHIIATMMAKAPEDRYASAAEAKTALIALERRVKPDPLPQHPPFNAGSNQKPSSKAILAAVAAVVVLGGAGAAVFYGTNHGANDQKVVVDKTPWRTYDLKGQQLFDKGAYALALKSYEKAYNRAKQEKPGPTRATKINTSLRELRAINFVLGNQKNIDSINEELLENPAPEPKSDEVVDVSQLERQIAKLNPQNVDAEWDQLIDKAAIVQEHFELTKGAATNPILDALELQLQRIPNQRKRLDQIHVLRSLSKFHQNQTLSNESVLALSSTLNEQWMSLTPAVSLALGRMLFAQERVDWQIFLKMIERAELSENLSIRLRATQQKARALSLLGRNDAALKTLTALLREVESSPSRDYSLLVNVLVGIAGLYEAEAVDDQALPLLNRAKAIVETDETIAKSNRYSLAEIIEAMLAKAKGTRTIAN
jgi:serine/threonine protein kinase